MRVCVRERETVKDSEREREREKREKEERGREVLVEGRERENGLE